MDFSSLEKFCAVATEPGDARAEQLARAQSNVTTRIEQLEEELEVQLFSRGGKRITLTPNGHRMLEYAQRLLSLAEEACGTMSPEQPTGRLRIGSLESTAATRLPLLLSTYTAPGRALIWNFALVHLAHLLKTWRVAASIAHL
jgi:DNA-binding transcriptional LysR family regulator